MSEEIGADILNGTDSSDKIHTVVLALLCKSPDITMGYIGDDITHVRSSGTTSTRNRDT
jgi:hypothetical protein